MYKIVHRMNDSLVGIDSLTTAHQCDIVLFMETKLCTNCSRPVPLYAYKMHLEVCKRLYKPEPKAQQKHKRKCVVCKKPCWPNYFRCSSCMFRIVDRNWDSWGEAV